MAKPTAAPWFLELEFKEAVAVYPGEARPIAIPIDDIPKTINKKLGEKTIDIPSKLVHNSVRIINTILTRNFLRETKPLFNYSLIFMKIQNQKGS